MNLLCAHHAKDPDTCRWVIENCIDYKDNLTVTNWINACKEYLELSSVELDNTEK